MAERRKIEGCAFKEEYCTRRIAIAFEITLALRVDVPGAETYVYLLAARST